MTWHRNGLGRKAHLRRADYVQTGRAVCGARLASGTRHAPAFEPQANTWPPPAHSCASCAHAAAKAEPPRNGEPLAVYVRRNAENRDRAESARDLGAVSCPACGSTEPVALGYLARTLWLRCRECGADFQAPRS